MQASTIAADLIPSINPATGEVSGGRERTDPSHLLRGVAQARIAQARWAQTPISERAEKLKRLRNSILGARNILADLIVEESGKPRVEALFADIFVALDTAEYFYKNAETLLRPQSVPHHSLAAKAKTGLLTYEPLGVIGIISSWNYPLAIPIGQIIPALVAGNAVICKTSELTPHCGAWIEKLFSFPAFPAGLVTIIQGGADVGQALIDATPDKIIFTGSVETGRRVAEACGKRLIPTTMELGGKDAMIVLADADLDVAASGAVWGSFTNCGQVCLSVERIFVEQSVSEKFAELCVEKTKKLRLGPGSDPATDVGPLIRPQHVERMTALIDDAEEAVTRANRSPFALSASVWTRDAARGKAIAAKLRAGAVMVNDAISYFAIAEAPHGGCGLSGWGRTHGKAGLLEMVQTKYIDVDRLPRRQKPWWYRYGPDLEQAADAFLQFEFANKLSTRVASARAALRTMFRDHGL